MRKTVILILAFCTISAGVAFGQSKKQQQQKVAVYVTGGEEEGLGEFVGAYLVDAITHNSGYSAVERTAEFLKAMNKEHEHQRSGNVDDEQIAKLGKQFGTKLVCVVKIGKIADKQFVQARLLDVETAAVRNSTKPFTFTLDDLEDVCVSVATQLLIQTKSTRTIQGVFGQ
ncbi:MAG: hypothetical protein LBT04_09470 [Prevotellaceae bacterium]|jgi:hypothetical protein|nr:hypothetical protein [Prevotellaceae bacterium]